ncbi:MAG: ribosome biogenesis factor YjgA, partial [Granulosicoccus sp.]
MATDEPADLNLDESDSLEEADAQVSKSQRKRDADAIRALGLRLSQLAPSELATVPLPDEILEAINTLSALKANGARKRQLGFLAKKLRQSDITSLETALDQIRLAARANTLTHHLIENWRDRLLGDVEGESASAALTQ